MKSIPPYKPARRAANAETDAPFVICSTRIRRRLLKTRAKKLLLFEENSIKILRVGETEKNVCPHRTKLAGKIEIMTLLLGALLGIGLVGSIFLLLFIFSLVYRNSGIKKIKSGKWTIAHWKYEPDEWKRYVAARPGNKINASTPPEIIITLDGILFGDELYRFFSNYKMLILTEPGNPSLLHFNFEYFARSTKVKNRYTFPIPRTREADVNLVIDAFYKKYERMT